MFIWIMVILKIPLFMLLYLVYWAVKSSGNEAPEPVRDPRVGHRPDRPPPRRPRPPRRGGPHAAPRPSAPGRVRARGRAAAPLR
jgi:hypothetical protein